MSDGVLGEERDRGVPGLSKVKGTGMLEKFGANTHTFQLNGKEGREKRFTRVLEKRKPQRQECKVNFKQIFSRQETSPFS